MPCTAARACAPRRLTPRLPRVETSGGRSPRLYPTPAPKTVLLPLLVEPDSLSVGSEEGAGDEAGGAAELTHPVHRKHVAGQVNSTPQLPTRAVKLLASVASSSRTAAGSEGESRRHGSQSQVPGWARPHRRRRAHMGHLRRGHAGDIRQLQATIRNYLLGGLPHGHLHPVGVSEGFYIQIAEKEFWKQQSLKNREQIFIWL